MLAKDAERLGTVRLLKSALGYMQIERKVDQLSDAEVIGVVQKEIKKRHDAIEQYTKGGRPELAEKERRELAVLTTFLPQPFSAEELEQLENDLHEAVKKEDYEKAARVRDALKNLKASD